MTGVLSLSPAAGVVGDAPEARRPAEGQPRPYAGPHAEVALTTDQPALDFDRTVEEWLTDDPEDIDGDDWWCVRTAPFPCPAFGCDFLALYLTAAHRIVVWASADNRVILRRAADAKQLGRDPHIVRYRPEMGAAISYDQWRRLGCPVHGIALRPPDKPRPLF